jgi:hypothetical protein
MALSQAAAFVEQKILGHGDNATTEQDITNPGRDRAKYFDPRGETMKALVRMGKNTVEVRESSFPSLIEKCRLRTLIAKAMSRNHPSLKTKT